MTNQEILNLPEESRKEGRKVLIYLISFFFVLVSVNSFFVYKALSTHSGVVVENSYEVGLRYNELIAEAKRRAEQRIQNERRHYSE